VSAGEEWEFWDFNALIKRGGRRERSEGGGPEKGPRVGNFNLGVGKVLGGIVWGNFNQ